MVEVILIVNAGSSSIKFALYQLQSLKLIARGQVTGLASSAGASWELDEFNGIKKSNPLGHVDSHAKAVEHILEWFRISAHNWQLVAAGHRVVHGGSRYSSPVKICPEVLADLRQLENLAPQHQPHNLAGVDALSTYMPELLQVACFDTAFHATQPETQKILPLPARLRDKGMLKYGFHGLSYEYLVRELPRVMSAPLPEKLICAHLGNGASACAIRNGESVATTMGFSTLDGLVMGSRCGSLDPGVLLHLLQQEKMDVEELSECLYAESGLLGLSGVSADVRQLEASSDPQAKLALEVYVSGLAKHVAGLAAVLQGVDAIVLSGGVGENSVYIRQQLLSRLGWLGCDLNQDANRQGLPLISNPGSKIQVYVVPTNEEMTIVRHVVDFYRDTVGPA